MAREVLEGANLGLHRFALFTACCTAFLIFVGGLVTSTESGLAVPDWPLSYGMLFPPMVGGIFYEHGHRMVAAFVGLLTVILAVWTWLKDGRAWIRWLSTAALLTVILQGILGGLTVIFLLPTPISMTHACLAQAFFCLTIALALFTSPGWKRGLPRVKTQAESISLPALCALTTGSIYFQLILGALMRHTKSGLAIPDFPLAFGSIIPAFTSEKVAIHFAHRLGAVLVTAMIIWTFSRIARTYSDHRVLFRPALTMLSLLVVQLALGAITIWTAKSVIPTTAHVATGALVLGTSVLLTLRSFAMVVRVPAWK
jgi:cytochrome c oxidase assembly protein subunit 15